MTFSSSSSRSEARALAVACREMSERFLRGGRLLAFGRGPLLDRCPARLRRIRASGDRRQARSACARSLGAHAAMARCDSSSGRYRDGLRSSGRRSGGVGSFGIGSCAWSDDVCAARPQRLLRAQGVEPRFAHSGSVYSSGTGRNLLSHAMGDGARLPGTPRTGPGCGTSGIPLSLPRSEEAGNPGSHRRRGCFD